MDAPAPEGTAALITSGRPVGLEAPAAKRLPCSCRLSSEPFDRESQTVRLLVDHTDCTEGHQPIPHEPVAPDPQTAWCACVVRSAPPEGKRQAFVIDFSRCTARSTPVPPTSTPRP